MRCVFDCKLIVVDCVYKQLFGFVVEETNEIRKVFNTLFKQNGFYIDANKRQTPSSGRIKNDRTI